MQTPLPAASPAELYDWHARPGAFNRLAPPWQRFEVVGGSPELAEGSRVILRLAKGPLRVRWVAEHQRVRPGAGFRDVQIAGPFALWQHDHLFEPLAGGGALLHDRIRFRPPGGRLGRLLMEASLRRDLRRTFRFRHATTAADLELHARYRDRPRLRVAISGAGGLVGRALTSLLTSGHEVVRLVRPSTNGEDDHTPGTAGWEPARGLLRPAALEPVDAVVHLAGESLAAGRWTARRRRRIRASRVDGTRSLIASLGRMQRPPRVLVSASAVGFYGDRGDLALDESEPAGRGFLAELCADAEEAALAAAGLGTRVAVARLGVVLSPAGGLLARLLPIFRLGLGGRLGDGRQRVSWISIDDAAAAILHLLMRAELAGPVNLTAPAAPSNRELTAVLATVLRRPAALPLPTRAVRLLWGRAADETMLSGVRARPARLEEDGFRFRHPELEAALRHLLGLAVS